MDLPDSWFVPYRTRRKHENHGIRRILYSNRIKITHPCHPHKEPHFAKHINARIERRETVLHMELAHFLVVAPDTTHPLYLEVYGRNKEKKETNKNLGHLTNVLGLQAGLDRLVTGIRHEPVATSGASGLVLLVSRTGEVRPRLQLGTVVAATHRLALGAPAHTALTGTRLGPSRRTTTLHAGPGLGRSLALRLAVRHRSKRWCMSRIKCFSRIYK